MIKRILALVITSPVWLIGGAIIAPFVIAFCLMGWVADNFTNLMSYGFTGKWTNKR